MRYLHKASWWLLLMGTSSKHGDVPLRTYHTSRRYELYRDAIIDLLWNKPDGAKGKAATPPELEVGRAVEWV